MGSVELRMSWSAQQVFLALSCLIWLVQGQDNGAEAPDFKCPEKNGKFGDFEQCDLFYICRNNVATIEFCPEGLLFDDKIPNHEKCVLPHNVDCGERIYVQEPSEDRDPKCERANGVFNHPDESVCDKYIQCDNGNAFELPCPLPLVFDVAKGSCVRAEQASERPEDAMERLFMRLMGSSALEETHLDLRICCKLTQSMPIPLTADLISHVIITRNQTSSDAAKETSLMP